MNQRRWGRSVCLVLLVMASLALPCRARADGPPSAERIETLIKQLDDASYPRREAASRELEALGPAVAPPLRRALAAEGLSLEAATRAKDVLNKVCMPLCGAVWRAGEQADAVQGLESGDVIVRAYGRAVWSKEDLLDAVSPDGDSERVVWRNGAWARGEETATFTVWRKGKEPFSIEARPVESTLAGMQTYPDDLGVYEQYGRQGAWRGDVRSALGLPVGSPGALSRFETAWKAGCRDAIVLKAWLAGLVESGKHADALKLAAREADNAQANRSDCLVLHGLLPREVARAQLRAGRREEALAALEAAASKAADAKAAAALSLIRGAQMALLAAGPPQAAMEFARRHCKEMDATTLPPEHVREAAEAMSARGDPNDVLALLDLVKDSPAAGALREAYEAQLPLAARHKARGDAPDTPVLLKWQRGIHPLGTIESYGRDVRSLPPVPLPCRIECEVKLDAWAGSPAGRLGLIGLALSPQGARKRSEQLAEIVVDHTGRARLRSSLWPDKGPSTASVGAPNEWHRLAIELSTDRVRFWLDGRALRTWYGGLPAGVERVCPSAWAAGGAGAVRDVKHYVLTPATAVEGASIEAAVAAMQEAMIAGDLKAATEHHRKLQALWAKVPEAGDRAEAARLSMDLYERLFSPEGLRMCTKEVMNWRTAYTQGRWELDGDWLVGTATERQGPVTFELPLLTGDIEITGVLDAENGDELCELLILYDGKHVHWAKYHPNAPTCHLKYLPPYAKIYVGAWWDREKGKLLPGEHPLGPMPFCLRIRGQKVALFAQDGGKPIIVFTGPQRNQDAFKLWSLPGKAAKAKFGRLVIRALPKDKDLEAPAELPKLTDLGLPATPTSGPAR